MDSCIPKQGEKQSATDPALKWRYDSAAEPTSCAHHE